MKKLTFIFALLCASVMGWAGTKYCNYEMTAGGHTVYFSAYKVSEGNYQIKLTSTDAMDALSAGCYMNVNGVGGYQMLPHSTVSNDKKTITVDIAGTPGTIYNPLYIMMPGEVAFTAVQNVDIDWENTCEGGGDPEPGTGGGEEPDPDPEPARASECFGAKGHFGNPSAKHVYYQIDYEDGKAIINLRSLTGYNLDFAEVHIVGVGNYAMTSNGAGGYSYTINNPTVDAEWYLRFLYSDTNMPGNEMTAENLSTSDANMIYYVVGSCTATTTENANIALASAGASATASAPETGNVASNAIDGNTGTRWETPASDPQWICVNFGARKKFNTVQLVHEGAYIKTYDIQISDDGENFTTIKHVSETLSGFPYEQTIELGFDYAAQYLRINGTERGSDYGYSLWELRAFYSGGSVLTSITLSAADTKALVGGEGVVLTATPKDQKGNPMVETVSYEITPAAAGHMSGNTYILDQVGNASIVAYNGSIRSSAVQILGVTSANLALSTNIVTDNKIIAQSEFTPKGTDAFYAVDGNMGSVWQGSPTNGNVNDSREYDSWFVVDLGAFYNIDLVALHFEGACSQLYHIDFSENNSDWKLGYNLVGAEGINARNDYWTDLDNNIKVRYVRFWSTKAATGYGMKLFEFEVYGTEWTSGDEEAPVMVSASLESSTTNSAIIAVSATDNEEVARFHVVDDANGIDANFTPSEGKITITGLTHATDYNFTITAKDASNNESENSMVVAVSTPFDGSINLALNQPCEAGYEDGNSAEVAAKANDGNNSTSWVTYGAHAAALDWWVVDLGKVYNLTNITALWANDAYATSYILQTRIEAPTAEDKADDAAWVTLETVSGVTAGEERSTNVSGVGRYVRFRATAHTGFFRLREFRVYASGVAEVDTEAPVMSSASLVSNTDVQAVIAVTATDNVGIARYHVVDAGNSFNGNFVAEEGRITVTGLTGGTSYNFTITAIDFFGNESDNSKSVAVTTTAHYTEPQAACAAPTWPANQVQAMYSPTYGADCGFDAWGSGTVYTQETYGKKYVLNNNGYFGLVGFSLNCLMMEKLHYDIWIDVDATLRIVPICRNSADTGNEPEYGEFVNLKGQQWNSIDLALNEGEFAKMTNWGNVYQMKIDQASNLTFWIANAYFYRESAIVDSEVPTNVSAILTETGFYSVKITAQAEDNSGAVNFRVMNGETILATGVAATATPTTITVNNLTPGTAYNLNVVAYDDAGNAASPVVVEANTKVVPAPIVPDFNAKVVLPVFTDAKACVVSNIQSGGWGEATQHEWLQIAPNDKVFYAQNFNYAGWHNWGGGDINASEMDFLHVDIYSTGMTQVSVTPISPGHEGSYTIELTPNAWTSADIPLSAYDASNIDWTKIFQFKFMGAVGGNELMIDNVYFWSYGVTTTSVMGGDDATGGWATFACAEKIQLPDGISAYKAIYSNEGNDEVLNLTELSDGIIPANAGVILHGTAGETFTFSLTNATPVTDMNDNMLVGCAVRTDISGVAASHDIFCMRYSELFGITGFFLYTGQYIPAGKAYLPVPKDPGAAPASRRVRFVFNNENVATGVEQEANMPTAVCQKVIENGRLIIIRNGIRYTAEGLRVE